MIVFEDAVVIEMFWSATSSGVAGLAPASERVERENCIVLPQSRYRF
jgi:hypothetical protein